MPKLLDFLKDKVPKVAVAIGDTLTGGAVSDIADAVGLQTDDPEQLHSALKERPELVARLQEKELDIAFKRMRARLEDVQSARQMRIDTGDSTADTLAYIIMGGFLASVLAVVGGTFFDYDLTQNMATLVGSLVGYLSAKAEQVVSFYFGSSRGSKKKEQTIAETISKMGTK